MVAKTLALSSRGDCIEIRWADAPESVVGYDTSGSAMHVAVKKAMEVVSGCHRAAKEA
jgi:hypothetical protein